MRQARWHKKAGPGVTGDENGSQGGTASPQPRPHRQPSLRAVRVASKMPVSGWGPGNSVAQGRFRQPEHGGSARSKELRRVCVQEKGALATLRALSEKYNGSVSS